MPPATGMPLRISRCTSGATPVAAASASAARHARFARPVGTPSRPGTMPCSGATTLIETPCRPSGGAEARTSSKTDTAWKTVATGW